MPQKSLVKKITYLTAFGLIILLFSFSPLQAASDYAYKDESGENIGLPLDLPIILLNKPAALSHVAPYHTPEIKTRIRKEGLEWVRELTMKFTKPIPKPLKDKITKIYILDKDYLIVGYAVLRPSKPQAVFRLNGIINYIQIYIQCDEHGLWREDLRFEKAKPGQ